MEHFEIEENINGDSLINSNRYDKRVVLKNDSFISYRRVLSLPAPQNPINSSGIYTRCIIHHNASTAISAETG